jgi:hypothetical protein
LEPIASLLSTLHGTPATNVLDTIDRYVHGFVGATPANDDVTMFALTRL